MMQSLLTLKNSAFVIDELKSVVGIEVSEFNSAPNTTINSELRIENLSYQYPDTEKMVLDNVSFVIKKGETIGIIGASGSGKSTLLKVLLRTDS